MTIKRCLAVLCAAAMFAAGGSAFAKTQAPGTVSDIVIAVPDTIEGSHNDENLHSAVRHLQRHSNRNVRIEVFRAVDAKNELMRIQPDLMIANSEASQVLSLEIPPLSIIATRKSVRAARAENSIGSLIVTRSNNASVDTLQSLRGKSIAAGLQASVPGYLAAMGEVKRLGVDYREYFSKVAFLGDAYPSVLSALLSGGVDAAVLPTCTLENLVREGLVDAADFRVVNELTDNNLSCRRSTDLYPDISLMAFAWTDEKVVRDATVAILQKNEFCTGYEWLTHVSHAGVVNLLRELEVGPYQHLRDNTPAGLYKRYKLQINFCLLLFLVLAFNEFRLRRLVEKRTAQLKNAMREQSAAEKAAREARLKIGALERRNIVGQMSSMIAHEIKSPVASILNFKTVLGYRTAKAGLDDEITVKSLESIENEARRIAGIVERVRSYAKNRRLAHKEENLNDLCRSALRYASSMFADGARVRTVFPKNDVLIRCDALEVELLVLNLLKNAFEAVQGIKNPAITLKVSVSKESATVTVSDNGPELDDAGFERLNAVAASLKPDGLGMGLSIVRGIADSHAALLRFERLVGGGVAASCEFALGTSEENKA